MPDFSQLLTRTQKVSIVTNPALLQSIFCHTAARVGVWQAADETGKVQTTARAWQSARSSGMDDALAQPFHPRNNDALSDSNTATIRAMYREMSACMRLWAVNGVEMVDTERIMATINTRNPSKRRRA